MSTITKPGRLVMSPDPADWIAHELETAVRGIANPFPVVLLEPVSERARAFAKDRSEALDQDTGWLFAEDWDCLLETAVATEVVNGWDVAPTRALDEGYFGRMLAAMLSSETTVDPDEVSDEAAGTALELVTRRER